MPLYTYTIKDAEEWDKIVRSFACYDVYYLSGYAKTFYLHGDGEPLLFYYTSDNLRGIIVVMKRDIADDPFFSKRIHHGELYDFITPYGYGGWLIEGTGDTYPLFCEYEKWCRAHSIVSEFVRYHPVLGNAEATIPFYDVVNTGNTISMDLSTPDTIWFNLTSKNRNMIRKALKSGVEIYRGQFPEIYRTFKEIYDITMEADQAKAYYYFKDEFYDSVYRDLPDEAQVFWAQTEGRIIAASIMISANGQMHYHLSGSLKEYRHLAPTNLLLYKAALWGCRNGCRYLHLGGGVGSKEDGLYKFKAAFNRNGIKQFAIGKKIYSDTVYEELVAMKEASDDEQFFPKYRADGCIPAFGETSPCIAEQL